MADPGEELHEIDGMLIRAEEIGFAAAEMLVCKKCTRNNPPNRIECLYCGGPLDVDGRPAAFPIKARLAEEWEPAFNVILSGLDQEINADSIKVLGLSALMDEDVLGKATGFAPPHPLVRVPSESEASEIVARLETSGIKATVVADRELDAATPPVRVRKADTGTDRIVLTAFNTFETAEFKPGDLTLIVAGQLTEENVEATMTKRKKELKTTEEKSAFSDASVLDLYFRGHKRGFRIVAHGFDFSVLGDRMDLFAGKNMVQLANLFQDLSPNARFVNDYRAKRAILDKTWPLARRNTSKGVQRTGLRISVSRGETINNSEQFTKYSRLLRRFLCHENLE